MEAKLYSPTPNKLLGTAQFRMPKVKKNSKEPVYPSYMMSPLWHDKIVEELREKGEKDTLQVYESLFLQLPKPSETVKQKLKQTDRDIRSRIVSRELKPIVLERVHIDKYIHEVNNPANKPIFFMTGSSQKRDKMASFQNQWESQLIQSDKSDLRVTLGSTDILKTMKRLKEEKITGDPPLFKSIEQFSEELQKQINEKESVVGCLLTVESPSTP